MLDAVSFTNTRNISISMPGRMSVSLSVSGTAFAVRSAERIRVDRKREMAT